MLKLFQNYYWRKRLCSFFQTDLDLLLKKLFVGVCINTDLHTHVCCRHTTADAYQNNYDVIFTKEATNSFTDEDYQYGLKYAKGVYGFPSLSNKKLFDLFSKSIILTIFK